MVWDGGRGPCLAKDRQGEQGAPWREGKRRRGLEATRGRRSIQRRRTGLVKADCTSAASKLLGATLSFFLLRDQWRQAGTRRIASCQLEDQAFAKKACCQDRMHTSCVSGGRTDAAQCQPGASMPELIHIYTSTPRSNASFTFALSHCLPPLRRCRHLP